MIGARGVSRWIIIYCLLPIAYCLLPDLIVAADLSNLKVTSSVSPSVIKIGERMQLKVMVAHDKGIDLFYPDETAQLAPFEVLKHKATTPKTGFGRSSTEIVYTVTAFEEGDLVVPPVLITAKDRFGNERNVRTVEHKVTVSTGVTVGSDIMDIIPPMEVTESRQYLKNALSYLPYILPLLAAIAVIIYLLSQGRPMPVIDVDARKKALDRLGMLEMDETQIERLYFDVSDIIKIFLHQHFHIDTLKMTSNELISSLGKIGGMENSLDDAADLFFDLDLVKFSPFSPSVQDAAEAVSRAERLIRKVP